MVTRWRSYLEQGTFVLSTDLKEINGQKVDEQAMVKFWTEPWPYWNMKERASPLWSWLHESNLVIFKVCTSLVAPVFLSSVTARVISSACFMVIARSFNRRLVFSKLSQVR